MESFTNALGKFFGVVVRGQTYLNLLYLFIAFPLGLAYFIFLVTGLSLGIALVIVWVGVLILLGVFAAWYGLAAFERWLAIALLREDIPPMTRRDLSGKNLWQNFTAALGNPVTWKGLVYLFARFPLGILSFVVVVTLLAISASLIGAPFYYHWINPVVNLTWYNTTWNPIWIIDTLPEALVACVAGLLALLISLHVFNGLAWVSGKFARLMLGNFSAAPAAPSAPVAPVAPEMPSAPETPALVA